MKNIEIHHALDGKTVVTVLTGTGDDEAKGLVESFARLRANDGVITGHIGGPEGTSFAIPARSIELIKVVESP